MTKDGKFQIIFEKPQATGKCFFYKFYKAKRFIFEIYPGALSRCAKEKVKSLLLSIMYDSRRIRGGAVQAILQTVTCFAVPIIIL